jgi:GR25 family glycosyltransferase involved in LPS biosynthesis
MIKILINLPKRTERRAESEKNIKTFFNNDNERIYLSYGVELENTTHGVREAHKNAVRVAIANEEKSALIFEDDILFRDGALDYFNTLMKNLPDDYDVILFGIYSGQIFKTENLYFDKVNKFSGLQMYLVNEKAYEKILNYSGGQPIDHWIGLNLNCYISKKHFSYQKDGYSDNAKTVTKYNETVLVDYKDYFFKKD